MLCDYSTIGGVKITQELVRALSDEPKPDPKSPGLNLHQIDAVAAKLHIPYADRTGDNWSDLIGFLREGRGVQAQLRNDMLHDPNGSTVGHSIFLNTIRKSDNYILGNNPLSGGARWYPPSVVKAAMTKFADTTGIAGDGLRFAIGRKVPRIAKIS
jgi:hypothetical protein